MSKDSKKVDFDCPKATAGWCQDQLCRDGEHLPNSVDEEHDRWPKLNHVELMHVRYIFSVLGGMETGSLSHGQEKLHDSIASLVESFSTRWAAGKIDESRQKASESTKLNQMSDRLSHVLSTAAMVGLTCNNHEVVGRRHSRQR